MHMHTHLFSLWLAQVRPKEVQFNAFNNQPASLYLSLHLLSATSCPVPLSPSWGWCVPTSSSSFQLWGTPFRQVELRLSLVNSFQAGWTQIESRGCPERQQWCWANQFVRFVPCYVVKHAARCLLVLVVSNVEPSLVHFWTVDQLPQQLLQVPITSDHADFVCCHSDVSMFSIAVLFLHGCNWFWCSETTSSELLS